MNLMNLIHRTKNKSRNETHNNNNKKENGGKIMEYHQIKVTDRKKRGKKTQWGHRATRKQKKEWL